MNEHIGKIITDSINFSAPRGYKVLKALGKGGFGAVFLVQLLDNNNNDDNDDKDDKNIKLFACKFIDKNSYKGKRSHLEKLKSEIKLHHLCTNDIPMDNKGNIVRFENYFEDNKFVYILLQYCCNGTLETLIEKRKYITEFEALYFMKQIISGIKYLHEKYRIIHRDLKLGNLLLDKNLNIKICDFGLATKLQFDSEKKKTICGTPNFIAPEIVVGINNRNYDGHSFEVDTWSVGVIFYTLLYGVPPFQSSSIDKTIKLIKRSCFHFPADPKFNGVSDLSRNLISKILNADPSKRISLNDICNYPIFNKVPTPISLPINIIFQRTPRADELVFDENNMNGGIGNLISGKKKFSDAIYVTKFMDAVDNYGIGYILSNGFTCGTFNDSTAILTDIKQANIYYINTENKLEVYQSEKFPQKHKKKLNLLKIFGKKLWNNYNHTQFANSNGNVNYNSNNLIWIRKWLKTTHGFIFKLNSKTIQANFIDSTKVVIKNSKIFFDQPQTNNYKEFIDADNFQKCATGSMKHYLSFIVKSTNSVGNTN